MCCGGMYYGSSGTDYNGMCCSGMYYSGIDCVVSGTGDDGSINRDGTCCGGIDCGSSGIGNDSGMNSGGVYCSGTDCGVVVQVMMVACIVVVYIMDAYHELVLGTA